MYNLTYIYNWGISGMVWIYAFRRQKTVDGGALYGVEKYTEMDCQLINACTQLPAIDSNVKQPEQHEPSQALYTTNKCILPIKIHLPKSVTSMCIHIRTSLLF